MTAEVIELKETPKQRRARKARESYAANREAEQARCKASKQRQRDGESRSRLWYDPEDYAEEWELLTRLGMKSDDIIARSDPSKHWFIQHVLPRVHRANCATCGEPFDPQAAHTLTRCEPTCGLIIQRKAPADLITY